MEASLETERLVKLANHNNCQPQDMLPEIIKAAEFIGAYSDQFCANPYEYGEGECTPSDEHVRNQLANAREVARI
ncbi:MAG: hypothetical protein Q8Q23_03385 [bacterium]|nr:hypothetical protein [bacterium]